VSGIAANDPDVCTTLFQKHQTLSQKLGFFVCSSGE
jgi:hypothetical protein